MAAFTAYCQVQMDNLTELALFADTNPGNVENRSTRSVGVVVEDVTFQIRGTAFEYVFDYPYAGHVTSFGVAIGGPLAYRMTGLTIEMRHLIIYLNDDPRTAMQQFLRGNDTVVGSTFDDGLFGFDGGDLMRGLRGDDFRRRRVRRRYAVRRRRRRYAPRHVGPGSPSRRSGQGQSRRRRGCRPLLYG